MTSKICIAHGMNIGFRSGGTNRVLVFAKALAENGYDVSLVVPKPVGKIPEDTIDIIKIYTVPIKPKRSVINQIPRALSVALKAKKIAEKEKAILQIEHSTLGGIAASLGCSNYILDVHDLEFDGSLYKSIPLAPKAIHYLERKAVSKASKIIVVSEAMKEFLVKQWEVPEEKITIIPNGCDIKRIKPSEKEIEGIISFIGVLHHEIHYEKIIELAKSVDKDARIYIIGDGPMKAKFAKMIKNEKLKNIILMGFLPFPENDKAYEILAHSQVCIVPLKPTLHVRVASTVKTLTYAALGKPIATDRDGTAVIFERNNAALVSDPAKPEEFIENVHKLLEDNNLRRKLGENAKRLVKDFTWEKQGEKLVRMYEKRWNYNEN